MSDNAKKEGRYLLADGPKTLAELNPKAKLRFEHRICETCEKPILEHYLIANEDIELRTNYWCDPAGKQASTGMKI